MQGSSGAYCLCPTGTKVSIASQTYPVKIFERGFLWVRDVRPPDRLLLRLYFAGSGEVIQTFGLSRLGKNSLPTGLLLQGYEVA